MTFTLDVESLLATRFSCNPLLLSAIPSEKNCGIEVVVSHSSGQCNFLLILNGACKKVHIAVASTLVHLVD